MKTFLLAFGLIFVSMGSAHAYTYASHYSGSSSGYLSDYNGGSSGIYQGTWRGSDSGYIRNFGSSSGGGYFGVPTGSSVGSSSPISRKHRGKIRRVKSQKFQHLPVPCGTYGRAPKSCPTLRYGALSN